MWWLISLGVAAFVIWTQRRIIGTLKSDLLEAEQKVLKLEKSIRANRKYELKKEEIDALLVEEEEENEKVVDKASFVTRINTVFDVSDENN